MGSTMTAEDAAQQIYLQAKVARLNLVSVDEKRIEILKQLAREQQNGVAAIKSQIDAEKVNAATVGMSVGQTAEYTAAQNAFNDAKRAGRVLSESDTAAIRANAAALGEAANKTDLMRFGYESLVRGPVQTLVQQLGQGASRMDALKASGMSALNSLSAKLADMASQQLWKAAFGGSSFSLSSLFSFGGGGSATMGADGLAAIHHSGYGPGDSFPTRNVRSSYFANAPRYHTGIGPGERAAVIKDDESVLTAGQMRALGKMSGVGQPITIVQNNDFRNADPGSEARIRVQLEQTKQAAIAGAVAAVGKVRSMTPSYLGSQR